MTVELASIQAVQKPWGSRQLQPWSTIASPDGPIGELWFGRADPASPEPALLLKLLFTNQPLSIQVHPDDNYAHSIGLPNGKTEAWYVVAADTGAQVALGLDRTIGKPELRAAIETGAVEGLVVWREVHKDEAFLMPAGTIHAIGAGLVLAEIQQRSDATFRMFDYDRGRTLNVDDAVNAAISGPAAGRTKSFQLSAVRHQMAASPYFVLERVSLPPDSHWELAADVETWVLVLEGQARFERVQASTGQAVFAEGQPVDIAVGQDGFRGLIAYSGATAAPRLLRRLDERTDRVVGIPQAEELTI